MTTICPRLAAGTPTNHQARGQGILCLPSFGIAVPIADGGFAIFVCVTAHSVHQRTREIGIRSALGASRFRVVWMIFRQSLPRIATGLVIGLVGGALLSRLTTTFVIVVVDSQDPLISLSTLLVITFVTGIAVLVPALRAARLNPCDALRAE
jgi:ABC-type antimicrobial peptide transport system permease subunit